MKTFYEASKDLTEKEFQILLRELYQTGLNDSKNHAECSNYIFDKLSKEPENYLWAIVGRENK